MTLLPDTDAFFYSRQKFQGILIRLELLAGEMQKEPELGREVIKKNLDAIVASCEDYAKYLRDLIKEAEKVDPHPQAYRMKPDI